MNQDQLRALEAIAAHGSFEAAAHELGVTPSAISQRIKVLEASLGCVVVRRATPATATDQGAVLVRLARQIALLQADALAALGAAPGTPVSLPVVVNADSLATWFGRVFTQAATWEDTRLQLRVEDQDHSLALLRRGDVVGAVTTEAEPVTGCSVVPLGAMRYRPAAAPALRKWHTRGGRLDWAGIPLLRFDAKDELQHVYLRERGIHAAAPTVDIPSSPGFVAAVRAGLGWGLLPDEQLDDGLATGDLVLLDEGHHDVPLYWQRWKLASPRVERLSAAVRAASTGLRRGGPS